MQRVLRLMREDTVQPKGNMETRTRLLQVQSTKIKWRLLFIAAASVCGLGHNNVHAPRGAGRRAFLASKIPRAPRGNPIPNMVIPGVRRWGRRLSRAGQGDWLLVTFCTSYKLLSSQAKKSGPLSDF